MFRDPSSSKPSRQLNRSAVRLLFPLCCLLFLIGCGSDNAKDGTGILLAKVGDVEITSDYYQRKLQEIDPAALPRDDAGDVLDTGTDEGRKAFMEVLINKELVYSKAKALGYDQEPNIVEARTVFIDYEASNVINEREVNLPAKEFSEKEYTDFCSRIGETRVCRYLQCDYPQEAEAAREMALSGADWLDVVETYHTAFPDPTRQYKLEIGFGQYGYKFQDFFYNTSEGDVSDVIESNDACWILKVDEIKYAEPADCENDRKHIEQELIKTRASRLMDEMAEKYRQKHAFMINEETLKIAYNALPEGETIFKPGTKEPYKRDELQPLDVQAKDLDLPFYSIDVADMTEASTLGDYKGHFDRMNVFQRPKRSETLGKFRTKLSRELTKALLNDEARLQGIKDDPMVLELVDERIEKMIVTKFFEDVIDYDVDVTDEQLTTFWQENQDDYLLPEGRVGLVVVCQGIERARQAREAMHHGTEWSSVMSMYNDMPDNDKHEGRTAVVYPGADGPISSVLLTLEPDGISAPILLSNNMHAVVMLDEIIPPQIQDLETVREQVLRRIISRREEAAFQALLDQWRQEFPVKVYDDRLAKMPSKEDLSTETDS